MFRLMLGGLCLIDVCYGSLLHGSLSSIIIDVCCSFRTHFIDLTEASWNLGLNYDQFMLSLAVNK